jgi:glycosyltransferase involved in cell wall biosynthesis
MKLCIFADTGWSLGQLYKEVARLLQADLLDWQVKPSKNYFENYDRILTLPGSVSQTLVTQYNVPKSKILLVAHAECDIQQLLKTEGTTSWDQYADYGVISDTLVCSSLSLGITKVPTVLRQGISLSFYKTDVPQQLKTVGYAALMRRSNEYGVEIKRGQLAQKATELAGLAFKKAENLSREQMPEFYQSVDAVIMSSLQEGGAMPPYEAAASSRLIIGTPVGDFPRLAIEGMGILAPLNDEKFVKFTSETLKFYKETPGIFVETCERIGDAAKCRSWPNVIQDWSSFINGTDSQSTLLQNLMANKPASL